MDIRIYTRTAYNGLSQKRLEHDFCWTIPQVPSINESVKKLNLNWKHYVKLPHSFYSISYHPLPLLHLHVMITVHIGTSKQNRLNTLFTEQTHCSLNKHIVHWGDHISLQLFHDMLHKHFSRNFGVISVLLAVMNFDPGWPIPSQTAQLAIPAWGKTVGLVDKIYHFFIKTMRTHTKDDSVMLMLLIVWDQISDKQELSRTTLCSSTEMSRTTLCSSSMSINRDFWRVK